MNAKRNRCLKTHRHLHGAKLAAIVLRSAAFTVSSWPANQTARSSTASAPGELGPVAPFRACLRSPSVESRNAQLSEEASVVVRRSVAVVSVGSHVASSLHSLRLSSWPNKPFVATTQRLAPLGSRSACAAVAPQRRRSAQT